jgi:hypothetical protein
VLHLTARFWAFDEPTVGIPTVTIRRKGAKRIALPKQPIETQEKMRVKLSLKKEGDENRPGISIEQTNFV